MKVAEYTVLYNFLLHNNQMQPWEAIRTIFRIRKMSDKLLKAIWVIINDGGQIPDVAVGDTSLAELVNDEGMNAIEAMLMLDWLERDPVAATNYMHSERMRKPIRPLNDEEKKVVEIALEKLKQKGVTIQDEQQPQSIDDLSEEDKQDIETSSELQK